MEIVVGNSEYMFLVFQSLQNHACLQVEGCNFQHHLSHVLTLCRSNLKLHCMGRKAAFFQQAFKFTNYTRNRSSLQGKKLITIKLEQTE